MMPSSTLSRLRDFLLLALGSAALFFTALLVLLRLRYPGLTQSNLEGTYWIYLGVAIAIAASCAALYAWLDPPLPRGPSGV